MIVYFSKTEKSDKGKWTCQIAPAELRKKEYLPLIVGDMISDGSLHGKVKSVNSKGTVTILALSGIPCVGIGYIIDRKLK